MLPAMSRDEILEEIVVRPWHAYVPLPDLQVIERPGWRQLVTPSVKRGGFNEVSFCQLGDDADAVIDATIAQYSALGCKFSWRVGPGSSPADLPARLARRGLVHGVGCGMARSTEMPIETLRDITIEAVDSSNVEVFTTTMGAGWNMDPTSVAPANRIIASSRDELAALRGDELARAMARRPRHTLWLARCGGEPAATAGAVLFDKSVYLLGGVVLEAYRGRGLYRALVAARMRYARDHGVMLATSHARVETSAPILERLGFETLCRYDNFTS